MSTKTTLEWTGGMSFDGVANGHHITLDTDSKWGGQDQGPRPKHLLLLALSGCSGMDTVSLLEKMRVQNYKFKVDIEADSTSDHPITYHTIRMDFRFWGEDIPQDKVVKAVTMSIERYCGAHAMLSRSANIISRIFINDEEVTK